MYHNPTERSDVPETKYDALLQYEWWKPSNQRWVKINTLDTSHLENLRNWLLDRAPTFHAEITGRVYVTNHRTTDWMTNQPLFVSIEHELQIRKNFDQLENALKKQIRFGEAYAFTGSSRRTDLVIPTNFNGRVVLRDAFTGTEIWSNMRYEDFLNRARKVTIHNGSYKVEDRTFADEGY